MRERRASDGNGEVDTAGDAFFVAFPTASGALAAAARAQHDLAAVGVGVRLGVHTGEVSVTETGYVGLEVHRAARTAASGHGGQVLVSSAADWLLETIREYAAGRLQDDERAAVYERHTAHVVNLVERAQVGLRSESREPGSTSSRVRAPISARCLRDSWTANAQSRHCAS